MSDRSRIQSQQRKEQYKELLDIGGVVGENAENTDILVTLTRVQILTKKSDLINSSGVIKDRSENVSELVMDAQVLKMSHELMNSAIQKYSSSDFNESEFVSALKRFTVDGNTNLINLLTPIWKTVRHSPSMLGTFDIEQCAPKENTIRQSQKRTQNKSQQVKPDTVKKLEVQEKRAQVLNIIFKKITQIFKNNGNQAIPYYKLIVDPTNFMNSIDNGIQIAFLLRDGHIMFGTGSDGLPTVRPADKAVTTTTNGGDFENEAQQFVSSLSPKMCNDMIKKYRIKEALINIDRGGGGGEDSLTQN